MKLLKQGLSKLVPFHTSLEQLGKTESGKYYLKIAKNNSALLREDLHKNENSTVPDLFNYSQRLNHADSLLSVINLFKNEIKKFSFFHEAEIFIMNEKLKDLIPVNNTPSPKILNFVKSKTGSGIIDWIGDSQKLAILPFTQISSANNAVLNCLLVPVYNKKNFAGILAVVTSFAVFSEESVEYRTLKMILDLTFSIIQQETLRTELISNYSELQALQSKMANDYKFTAVGELTLKALENISSPLQVISSCADLIESDYPNVDKKITETLITQVNEVKEVFERLTYFITSPEAKAKIQSCKINDAVKDFYKLIEHPLKTESYECVLDLDENIPPILSNENYLKQILINAFSLINPFNQSSGGIIIQTRYSNEIIKLKLSFTNHIDKNENNQMGLKILSDLMEKHEGNFVHTSNQSSGAILTFSFPLKRKNRR